LSCGYNITYFDAEQKSEIPFKCKEEPYKENSRCIFHLDRHTPKEIEILRDKIKIKIIESIDQNSTLFCIGYKIPSISMKETFSKPVYFTRAKFIESVNFTGSTFCDHVDFTGCIFKGYAYFFHTKFLKSVKFIISKFKGETQFQNSLFHNVDFFGTTFESNAYFSTAEFKGRSDFLRVKFQDVEFVGTKFYNRPDFFASIFSSRVEFRSTDFLQGANFRSVEFESDKIYFYIEDLSKMSFLKTDISKIKLDPNSFVGSEGKDKYKIYDEKIFEWNFHYLFDWDEFPNNKNDIIRLKDFLKFLGFDWITYIELEKKDDVTIGIKLNPSIQKIFDGSSIVVDNKGSFESSNNSIINLETLSEDSFKIQMDKQHQDLRLTVNDWIRYIFPIEQIKNKKYVLIETVSLNDVLSEYRNLRENFEYNLRYEDAEGVFIREMELKRNYKQLNKEPSFLVGKFRWIHRTFSLTGLYYHLFKYGESFIRPLILIVFPFFIFSIFYWLLTSSNSIPFFYDHNFIEFKETIRNEIIKSINFDIYELKSPIDSILNLLILPIAATLFIPLRRRFERRFRH